MKRVMLTWIVEQFEKIGGLDELTPEAKGISAWLPIVGAKNSLREMVASSVYSPFLRVSFERANALFELLEQHVPNNDLDENLELSEYQIWEIKNRREQFESVLRAELGTIPVFLITKKGAYDIETLIDRGEDLFPEGLLLKVPECSFDVKEAGKCLAYECSTACGFHTFRVVEATLRRYWDIVALGECKPENPTLGVMSGQLIDKGFGDKKVLECLKQLTKLHRNPISHPDVALTQENAISILGMVHGAITHMLESMPVVPLTTGVHSIEAAGI